MASGEKLNCPAQIAIKLTGDDLEDHTTHAAWLGEPATLNLDVFRKKAQ